MIQIITGLILENSWTDYKNEMNRNYLLNKSKS